MGLRGSNSIHIYVEIAGQSWQQSHSAMICCVPKVAEYHWCLAANLRIDIYNGKWFLTDYLVTVDWILMIFSADPREISISIEW